MQTKKLNKQFVAAWKESGMMTSVNRLRTYQYVCYSNVLDRLHLRLVKSTSVSYTHLGAEHPVWLSLLYCV